MKSVLISIKPKYCELIANGKKTVEVRKTRPKIKFPFKCYIYCTKGETLYRSVDDNNIRLTKKGRAEALKHHTLFSGKVIGEFVCDTIMVDRTLGHNDLFATSACLDVAEAAAYCLKNKMYCWHISKLVIYDEPKELGEFSKPIECHRGSQRCNCVGCWDCEIKRPPQSWCYVKERKENDTF